jgi:3-dehydro-L-gulonate 2-dehydrogenase
VQFVKDGVIDKDASPRLENGFGVLERWDGASGPGILNANWCMSRAIELAKEQGIGCVALRNTNHWMRGGTYGWQAAEAGCIGICFTNTRPLLPPWGGLDTRLGNNPLVIAVPRPEGHVVLDMAVSQYSYGKLLQHRDAGEPLAFPGGYDEAGQISSDVNTILATTRLLPIGLWKGSGLALMLDLLATILSQGQSTAEIAGREVETSVSQVFIAIKPQSDPQLSQRMIDTILAYTASSEPVDPAQPVRYPGEGTLQTRLRNLAEGIPVNEKIWATVLAL